MINTQLFADELFRKIIRSIFTKPAGIALLWIDVCAAVTMGLCV